MIDTHCHLDSCEPPDAQLVAAARRAGVTRIATVGMHDDSIARALEAARRLPEVHAIAGRHPHFTAGWTDADLEPIERAGAEAAVVAIGETGLDYHRDRAPRADQLRAFEAQVDLAARLGKPVVIHTRAAEQDTFAVLAEHAERLTVVLHCFSAPERVQECADRGYMTSFAGNVTYRSAADLQAAARELPAELLLVETDAPYLTPVPHRGEPNEPAHVRHTAEFVARLRDMTYDELDATVERNAARVFGW